MSVQVRIICVDEAINSAAIRKHKNMMVHTKAVPLGSILFGARVIDPQDEMDRDSKRRADSDTQSRVQIKGHHESES